MATGVFFEEHTKSQINSRPLKSNILFDYQQISSDKASVYLQVFVSLQTESLQIFMIKTTNNSPSLFSNLSGYNQLTISRWNGLFKGRLIDRN